MACCNASRLFAAMSFRTSVTDGADDSEALGGAIASASAAADRLTLADEATVTGENTGGAGGGLAGEDATAEETSMAASLLRASASEKSIPNIWSLGGGWGTGDLRAWVKLVERDNVAPM
jgi:hypothetical protein